MFLRVFVNRVVCGVVGGGKNCEGGGAAHALSPNHGRSPYKKKKRGCVLYLGRVRPVGAVDQLFELLQRGDAQVAARWVCVFVLCVWFVRLRERGGSGQRRAAAQKAAAAGTLLRAHTTTHSLVRQAAEDVGLLKAIRV